MATGSRNSVGRVLMGVLIFQLVLGGLLFLGDIQNGFRLPALGPNAPSLSDPIRPGDQTRRFRPDRAPPGGRPMPSSPLPDRLTLTPLGDGHLLEGGIAQGDSARVIKQIEETEVLKVTLNSPGGSVADALELGRYLRRNGITTGMRADDICYSACPYLLAGGVARNIDPDASVGVHQHYFGKNTLLPAFVAVEDIQRGQGEVMTYLDDMGIDPLVMRHALVTPPDQIYVLVAEELERYGFVTDGS